jgi:histidinol dehydrogenase
MRIFDTATDSLESIRTALTARDTSRDAEIERVVRTILNDIKLRGDAAVLDYTRQFDWPEATMSSLALTQDDLEMYETQVSAEEWDRMDRAMANIMEFHVAERGQLQTWMQPSAEPVRILGQMIQPVKRVGIYVPGGKAAYPSTVLMTAIPAFVAGVEEIVLCTPPSQQGEIPAHVGLAASRWVEKLFKIGGAQAIAAMAYGTETVPKCDVIVGPGNTYMNIAKRLVYGEVGIDMLAGPSEIAIVADDGANPVLIAADLLAQTEHGPDNKGVLFCSSSALLEQTQAALKEQRAKLSRQEILQATEKNLFLIHTASLEESIALCNHLAPEHLELMVREPLALLPRVKNAGAVLLGDHTSAPLGDYWAGPSHTLPTAGAARFSSPLSVATFMKRTSILYYSQEAAAETAEDVASLAEAEGFDAHAFAARLRK